MDELFEIVAFDFQRISKLVLLMTGCLQATPAEIRMALALLQDVFHQKLLALLSKISEVYHLAQHLLR